MAIDISEFDHPAWLTAAGTGVGYLLILVLLTVLLFLVPWGIFVLL
ncbi:hypothetical protein HALLA_10460 [Halostagnicola larsenii XH-48]|uniref:Uncharacterized protein n=1 Tax=Halostagnicola larsenii XH-48 TaxID=797299 RepID=W0JPV0_9EURY|nr:hypothetical protein [Halostagnicola larsenii]AHF99209.1 hypothetical protein HALLA_10460 [Halostagnicola larsenii XH-48]